MNITSTFASMSRTVLFAFLCFASSQGLPSESTTSRRIVDVRSIKATPVVLEDSGICLEGRRDSFGSHGVDLKIHIPIVSPVGRASYFLMEARQGFGGRDTTTSMYLDDYDSKWAPTIRVTVWDLSDEESLVRMLVGLFNDKTGRWTDITFSNTELKELLAMNDNEEDNDTMFRTGCRRWDSEKAKRPTRPH